MIQKFRHYVHLLLAFVSDYLSLLGRPLFYHFQIQFFRKDIHSRKQNNSLCILGNGPSLVQMSEYVNEMKNFDFCAVNQSINTDFFFQLKPKMYVIADIIYFLKPEMEFVKKTFENLGKIDWEMNVYIPYSFPNEIIKKFDTNPFVKVCRYANNQWEPELKLARTLKMWFYRMGWVSPNCSNVSIAAIYTALLSGYKKIILLGFEHSWMKDISVNDQNKVVLVDRHYYGETEHIWLDHHDQPLRLIDFLNMQLSTFTAHMNLRSFADYLDAKIVNCTKGSYIDAYERGKIEELINS